MIEIIPAIIPNNLKEVEERFSQVLGLVKKVQMDIADGVYTERKTWPFNSSVEELDKEKMPFASDFILQLDMLVVEPIQYIHSFYNIGFRSFIFHIDSSNSLSEGIEKAKDLGCEVGIGIKPSIETEKLGKYLEKIDFVQFMGNDKVGFNGVNLDTNVLQKIASFHKNYPQIPIQIDIGVNFDTAHSIIEAGATRLISGSAIFNTPDIKDAIIKLQNATTNI